MENVFNEILGRSDNEKNVIIGQSPVSFSDLFKLVDRIETHLTKIGCNENDRVGIAFDQGSHYIASILGIRKKGCVSVPMSLDWTNQEFDRILSHSDVRYVISSENIIGTIKPNRNSYVDEINCFILEYNIENQIPSNNGDAIIIYTSGTTNKQKGVVLTEEGISNNVFSVAKYLELCSDDSSPIFTSTCYAYSISMVLTHAFVGASILPIPDRLMFPVEILDAISKYQLTGLSSTPTALNILLQTKHDDNLNFDSLRYIMTGGQPFSLELYNQLNSKFSGTKIINMYGCSENSPRISYHYINGLEGLSKENYYSVGRPILGTKINVVDSASKSCDSNKIGEIIIKGNSLMSRYWNEASITDDRLIDGWFHTGDLGYFDKSGLLFITGRNDTRINIGNEKVSPEEVEMVINNLDGIEDVLVFGSPHPILGECVEAKVVLKEGYNITSSDIIKSCRIKLSGYKIPSQISVVDAIPKTAYGKIDRKR
jgi:long-chain acyl-CoA synthetase